LLNNESVMSIAESIAKRLRAAAASPSDASPGRHERQARLLFDSVLNVPAGEQDYADVAAFVREMEDHFTGQGAADAGHRAWTMACQAILASSRFQILQ
jgi:hypothetical protein